MVETETANVCHDRRYRRRHVTIQPWSTLSSVAGFILFATIIVVFSVNIVNCDEDDDDVVMPEALRDVVASDVSTMSADNNDVINEKTLPIDKKTTVLASNGGSRYKQILDEDIVPSSTTGFDQVLSLLLDLSRNVAAMRDVINDIRFQNHVTYRQLKRVQLVQQQNKCSRVPSQSENDKVTKHEVHDGKQPQPYAAALYAERPQSDQQSPGGVMSNQINKVDTTVVDNTDVQQQQHQQQQQQQQPPSDVTTTSPVPVEPQHHHRQQPQPTAVVHQSENCPKEFTYSAELNSCYRLAGDRTTWRLARQRCRDMNADLAAVDSAKEQRYLNERARLGQDTRHCDFWIGLVRGRGTEDGGSSWHWIGDHGNGRTPEYTNWNVNEPNNANSYEHCTQMLWVFNWRWNDAHCNYGNACYICQVKPLGKSLDSATASGVKKPHLPQKQRQ